MKKSVDIYAIQTSAQFVAFRLISCFITPRLFQVPAQTLRCGFHNSSFLKKEEAG